MRKRIGNNICVAIFYICWIFVGAVGAIDTGLTVHLRTLLIETEKNPVARMILEFDDWEVSRFIGLKMFGTILVLGFVVHIFKRNTKNGLVVIGSLAIFQALLLFYLLL